MPGIDTGLTPDDQCIYIRAAMGDDGAQPPNGARKSFQTWWLSPDIELPGNKANPGNNNITVRFWLKPGCPLPADSTGTTRVRVQLYVGDPQLVTPVSNVHSISSVIHLNPTTGSNTDLFQWTLPNPPPATGPQSPGHKCLVARCFPHHLPPSSSTFHAAEDSHIAQRNICIVVCQSPCGLVVQTTNVHKKKEAVRIVAVADLEPNEHVLKVVKQSLSRFPGFKRLVTKAPPPFDLLVQDVDETRILNRSERPTVVAGFSRLKVPNVEAQVMLKPRQTIKVKFLTDLEGSAFGDARIYHMMHIGSDKRVQGGLTLVLVRVKEKR